eukprot:gene12036-13278_t
MESTVRRKGKGKKGKSTASTERPKKVEETELVNVQSVVNIGHAENGEEEDTRKPLARSDSDLTSVIVVGEDDSSKQAAVSSSPSFEDAQDISSMAALDQVRKEPSLVEPTPDEENQPLQEQPDDHEVGASEPDQVNIKDQVASAMIDADVQDASREPDEEESKRRNAVPEGEEDTMEVDSGLEFEKEEEMILDKSMESIYDYSQLDKENHLENPWQSYKDMNKGAMDSGEISDHDGENEGIDVPKSDDVPDIDEFMKTVEDEDSGLGAKTQPPPLYENAQQKEMHKYVVELQQKMADEEISAYLDEFERRVEEEIIQIGDISLEDVQEEERRLREEHIAFQQREAKIQRDRQKEFMLAMERAKKHVMTMFREKCKQILMRQEHMMQRDRLKQDRIHRSFRRSENQLLKALAKKKGEIKTMYSDLIFSDGQYDGSKCRRWKVDWKKTPQPIQIKLKCLRGVKNKLPASRYILMASLYSRLGGHIMKWSKLKGQQWGGATLPITHDGEFYNIELTIDQSVFEVCPSSPDMKAGMVLMFELFILRGAVTPIDKVVGWGCFPISDGNFDVVEGKYKTALLRGNVDSSIDKFGTIEKLIASDIDHWLCNLYFEIVKLPKYLAGQKEYEVELQFTSQTSSSLSRQMETTGKPLYPSDKEKPIPPSVVASNASLQSSQPPPYEDHDDKELHSQSGPSHYAGATIAIDVPAVSQKEASGSSHSLADSTRKLRKVSQVSAELRQRKVSNAPSSIRQSHPSTDEATHRPFTVYGSRKVVEEKGVSLGDDESSSESQYSDDDDVYVLGKGSGLKPVEGHPGIFYKVRQTHQSDNDASKRFTMLPRTPLIRQQEKRRKLTHLEELEQHTVAIKAKRSAKQKNVLHRNRTKLQYVMRMLPIELDLWAYKSKEFWSMMLMLVLTWWIRMYLHYVGQYVLLVGLLIPINSIEYLPYTVNIRFQNTILRTKEEIALLVIGPFTNLIVLILMILLTYFFQLLYDKYPNFFSRFLMAFGIHTALDPIWILIVDTAKLRYRNLGTDNPIGDAYRLFFHFSRYYSSGTITLFISISITLFLYATTIFCACTVLYMYFMRLHNNGRMMDIYWRLHGNEANFFVPYDLEMSNDELAYICRKAEQWRGQEGEQRKVNVYRYSWEEEEVVEEDWSHVKSKRNPKGRSEAITHVSIHTIHLDGLRELFRHFLRLHNGAIVEVFGEGKMPASEDQRRLQGPRRDSFQGGSPKVTGYRNRSYSVSSGESSVGKHDDGRRESSQFLGLPVN